MTIRELTRIRRHRAERVLPDLAVAGVIIVGYTGSATSARALRTAAERAAGPGTRIVAVCAIREIHHSSSSTFLHDALKADAYLLSEQAALDETLRRGIELARSVTQVPVTALAVEGDPVRVLADAARRHDAAGVVVGMGAHRPSTQVRHIARRLPDDIPLWVTDGHSHIHMTPPVRGRSGARPAIAPSLPRTVGA
ncbi:universal stress protein [Gordonia sp. OPL2]|uniref:universal stress protein n=1 Tax=Gordonia sp. OPL2 TaxID=2486274 RepID=UPI001655559B|nr:universal stress protein [Gordonia sp. OPL2]